MANPYYEYLTSREALAEGRRLEALRLAVEAGGGGSGGVDAIVVRARKLEEYLKGGGDVG